MKLTHLFVRLRYKMLRCVGLLLSWLVIPAASLCSVAAAVDASSVYATPYHVKNNAPDPLAVTNNIHQFSFNHPDLRDLMISVVAKDSLQRLWIGSETGLFRYDGFFVEKIDSRFSASDDAPAGIVSSIMPLDERYIIIRTNPSRLYLFDIHLDQFVNEPYDLQALPNQVITSLLQSTGSTVIGVPGTALVFFDTQHKTSSYLKHPQNLSFYSAMLANGYLYALSINDLAIIDPSTQTILQQIQLPTQSSSADQASIVVDEGGLHLLHNGKHWRLQDGQFKLLAQLPNCELNVGKDASNSASAIAATLDAAPAQTKLAMQASIVRGNKDLFFNTPPHAVHLPNKGSGSIAYYADNCGIYRYFPATQQRQTLVANTQHSQWLNRVSSDTQMPTEQNFAVSTLSGLFLYNDTKGLSLEAGHPTIKSSMNYFHIDNDLSGAELNNKGGQFYSSKRSHFAGISSPLLQFLLDTDKLRRVMFIDADTLALATQDNGLFILKLSAGSLSDWQVHAHYLSQVHVRTIYRDGEQLWIGTELSGIHLLDLGSMQLRELKLPGTISSGFEFYPLANNKLLINTHYNLLLVDKSQVHDSLVPEASFFAGEQFRALAQDKQGHIWLGTHDPRVPIIELDAALNQVALWDNTNSKMDHHVFDLHFDGQDTLWVATWGAGIGIKTLNSREFLFINEQTGLASDTVFSVYSGNDGNIWASTAKGLSRISPCSMPCQPEITNYGQADGLHTTSFDAEAHFQQSDGTLVFAGIGGAVWFNPAKDIGNNPTADFSVHFTQAFVDSQPSKQSVFNNTELKVTHETRQLDIRFTSPNYITPERNQYRYRINQAEWVALDKPQISLSFLPHGSYNIEATSANNEGAWSAQTAKLKVIITPPLWQHPLAYFLYTCALLGLSYFLLRLRHFTIKKRNEELETLIVARTQKLEQVLQDKERLFENISHEFRTPLTIILGKAEEALAKGNDSCIALIHEQSARLFDLVEQLLKLAEIRAVSLQSAPIVPYNEISMLVNALQGLAQSKKISVVCKLKLDQYLCVELLEDTLALCVNNLLKNAIAYSSERSVVNIHTYIQDQHIVIEVSDQGPGFSDPQGVFERFRREHKDQSGSGLGLAIVKEIVEANSGFVRIDNQVKGAKVTIHLPMRVYQAENYPHDIAQAPNTEFVSVDEAQLDLVSGNILLVEDEPDLQQYIANLLTPHFTMSICNNGEEALAFLAKNTLPDLILSDVMMPKMDGFALSKHIKSGREFAHLPVILLTAKADLQSQREGLSNFADDYITKPFSSQNLILKISNQLKTRFAHQHILVDSLVQNTETDNLPFETNFADKLRADFASNFSNPEYNLADIAQRWNMTEKTLTRRLKSFLNNTFSTLLRDFRLHQAKQLLQQGENISDVSFGCGFNSETYFGRCYKARYGITPRQERKSS